MCTNLSKLLLVAFLLSLQTSLTLGCTVDADCTNLALSQCNTTSTFCVLCSTSADCAHFSQQKTCSPTGCVQCMVASDCVSLFSISTLSCNSSRLCQEPCGDGKNNGFLQCDDGNTANGDGCSSSCLIESGYNCFGGSATTADTCVFMTSTTNPNMLTQDLGVGKMLIYFDQPMMFQQAISNILNFSIFDSNGNNIVTSFSLASLGSNSTCFNRYIVTYFCSQDFGGGASAVISLSQPTAVRSSSGFLLNNATIRVISKQYYQSVVDDRIMVSNLKSGLVAVEYTMYGLSPFALVTHNIDIWIKVMEWFQILSYTQYLNAIMPENYVSIIPMYDFARAKSLPNMFSSISIPDNFQIAPEPFNSLGVRTFFLWNAGTVLEIFLACVGCYLVFTLLIFTMKPNNELRVKLNYVFMWTLGIHVMNFINFELFFSMGLQFCSLTIENIGVLLGESIAFVLILFIVFIFITTFNVIKRKRQYVNDPLIHERYSALYSLFTISKSKFPFKIIYWLYLRKFVFIAFLIAMTQLRRVQAFGFFGILFVELIYILLIKPYAKKPFLTLQVITHVMISGIFFYIDYLDNKGETDAKAIYQSGWILIGIAGGVGLFNLLYLMVCSLYPILRLFKNEKIERVHSASSTIEADDPKKAIDSKAAFSKDIKPDDSTLEKKLDDKSGADASKGGTKSENKEPELPIPKEIITVPKEEPKTADLKKTESIPKSDKESPDKKRSKLEEDKWESLSKKESLTKKEPIINKESLNKNESMKKIESVTKLPENSNRDEAGVTPNKDELKPSQSEKKLEHHSSVLSFNPNKNTSKKNTILPEEEGKKAPFSQEEEEAIKNIDKSHLDTSKEEVEQNSIMYLLPENNPASSYYPGSDKASFNSSSRQTGYYPFAPIRKPFREELDLSRIIVKNPKDPKNLNLEVKKDDHVIDILEDFSSKRVHNKYLDSGREPEFLAPPGWDDLSEASDQRAKKIIPPTVYDNIIPKFEENPIIKENPAKRRRKFSNSTVTDGEAYKSNNAINL